MILELTGASWSGENRRCLLFKSQAVAEQQLRAERPTGAADSAGDIGALLGLRAEHSTVTVHGRYTYVSGVDAT